ncbi:hypothetical protein D3C75_729310 [compost metagenome]
MDAHLVFQRAAGQRVAHPDAASGVGQELGHDEQRDALGALRGIGQTGKDDVHDVVGEIVLAGRDEDLGTTDLVAAVSLRLGAGAQHAEVGTAVRLGQAHGAGPLAGYQPRQEGSLLLGGAVGRQGVHRAVRQPRVHAPGPVGLANQLADHQTQRLRQTLAAVLRLVGQARHAQLDVLAVGLLEAARRLHPRGRPGATLDIADPVQRRQHLLAELRGLLEDRVHHIGGGVLAAGQALIVLRVAEQLVANESQVAQGGFVLGHGRRPLKPSGRSETV